MSLQTLPLPPSELGESPFWHPTEKSLYWCDIQGQAVHAWHPDSGHHRQWRMPSEPGCCAPAADGRLVIGLRNGFYLLDTAKDSADPTALSCLALLPPEQHDTTVLRLNDGRCDTAGRFWAGSVITPRTAPNAALWCLQADPASATGYRVRYMTGDNFTANGLAFSPDNRTMYWSNTPEHRIDQFDFEVVTGEVTNRRPWVQFDRKVDGQPYGGRPDGAAVDVGGTTGWRCTKARVWCSFRQRVRCCSALPCRCSVRPWCVLEGRICGRCSLRRRGRGGLLKSSRQRLQQGRCSACRWKWLGYR